MTTPNDPGPPAQDGYAAGQPLDGQPSAGQPGSAPPPYAPLFGQPPQPAPPVYGQPAYGTSPYGQPAQAPQPYGQQQPYGQAQQYGQPQQFQPGAYPQPGVYGQPGAYPQMGYPAASMDVGPPGSVTTASVLLFMFAGFSAIIGVLVLFVASAASNVNVPGIGAVAGAAAFIGALFIGFAALDIVVAIKIRAARPWARITAIVWSTLWLLLWFAGLFNSHSTTTRTINGTTTRSTGSSPGLALVFLVATGLVIYLLAIDKRARAFFQSRR